MARQLMLIVFVPPTPVTDPLPARVLPISSPLAAMAMTMSARIGAPVRIQNRPVARSFTATRHAVRSAAKLQVMAAKVTLKMPDGEQTIEASGSWLLSLQGGDPSRSSPPDRPLWCCLPQEGPAAGACVVVRASGTPIRRHWLC